MMWDTHVSRSSGFGPINFLARSTTSALNRTAGIASPPRRAFSFYGHDLGSGAAFDKRGDMVGPSIQSRSFFRQIRIAVIGASHLGLVAAHMVQARLNDMRLDAN